MVKRRKDLGDKKLQTRITDLGDPSLQTRKPSKGITVTKKGSVSEGQAFVRAREKKTNELKKAGVTQKNAAEQATRSLSAAEQKEKQDEEKVKKVNAGVITKEGEVVIKPKTEAQEGETRGILDRLTNVFGDQTDPETGEPVEVIQGTVPIGGPGGFAKGLGTMKLGNVGGTGAKINSIIAKEKTIAGIVKTLKVPRGAAEKIFKLQEAKSVSSVIKSIASSKIVRVGVGLAASSLIIGEWFAADNVVSGGTFYFKDVRDQVQFQGLPVGDANALMDDYKESITIARRFINIVTLVFPPLWPSRQLFMSGIDTKIDEMDNIQRQINGEPQVI